MKARIDVELWEKFVEELLPSPKILEAISFYISVEVSNSIEEIARRLNPDN